MSLPFPGGLHRVCVFCSGEQVIQRHGAEAKTWVSFAVIDILLLHPLQVLHILQPVTWQRIV